MAPHSVLLAFANTRSEDGSLLPGLAGEEEGIKQALMAPEADGRCEVVQACNDASLDKIVQRFDHYRGISVFHYGGHAAADFLVLQDEAGEGRHAHADGLVPFLRSSERKQLTLVFLNGCMTAALADRLIAPAADGSGERPIPVVIGTLGRIADHAAMRFSVRFYQVLAKGASPHTAFVEASNIATADASPTAKSSRRDLQPATAIANQPEKSAWLFRHSDKAVWESPLFGRQRAINDPRLAPLEKLVAELFVEGKDAAQFARDELADLGNIAPFIETSKPAAAAVGLVQRMLHLSEGRIPDLFWDKLEKHSAASDSRARIQRVRESLHDFEQGVEVDPPHSYERWQLMHRLARSSAPAVVLAVMLFVAAAVARRLDLFGLNEVRFEWFAAAAVSLIACFALLPFSKRFEFATEEHRIVVFNRWRLIPFSVAAHLFIDGEYEATSNHREYSTFQTQLSDGPLVVSVYQRYRGIVCICRHQGRELPPAG